MAELQNITNKTTPEGKGFRTLYQAAFGVVTTFLAGLWGIPGVPEYVTAFARNEGVSFLLFLLAFVGIPAGLLAYFQNRRGK